MLEYSSLILEILERKTLKDKDSMTLKGKIMGTLDGLQYGEVGMNSKSYVKVRGL